MGGSARISCAAFACGLFASLATAAPVLRSANIHVTMTSPTSCEVTMALTVEGASDIEHRVDGRTIDLVGVRGAAPIGELRNIGRTRSLVLRPTAASYEFRYRTTQSEERTYTCPIWLPTTPTDGISRTVRFMVDLPPSAAPGGSMPAMTWTGTRGTTTVGHVPAFVRVPFAVDGNRPGWDIAHVMDTAAVVVFAGASALWIWRRRR